MFWCWVVTATWGWPAALHFSEAGHDVTVVDSYIRRRYDLELKTDSLVPIATLPERIARWRAVTGAVIGLAVGDLTDAAFVTSVMRRVRPDTVVHLAEQRSAPYSMMDQAHAVHTQVNNVVGTLNVLWAIAQTDPTIHLVKLGTMGEYGTPNIDIEEGWLRVTHNGRTDVLPYPKQARILLPPVEGPRQPQHPLLLPSLGAAGDRPQSGRRLRSRDRADPACIPSWPPGSTMTPSSGPCSTASSCRL